MGKNKKQKATFPLEHSTSAQYAFYNSYMIFSSNALSGSKTLPSFSIWNLKGFCCCYFLGENGGSYFIQKTYGALKKRWPASRGENDYLWVVATPSIEVVPGIAHGTRLNLTALRRPDWGLRLCTRVPKITNNSFPEYLSHIVGSEEHRNNCEFFHLFNYLTNVS